MKKTITLASIISILLLTGYTLDAQEKVEKKVEKRVKIVTVDKSGERVEIDTIFTGDEEGRFLLKDGEEFVWSAKKDMSSEAGEASVYILKKGDGEVFTIMSSGDHDSLKWIDEKDGTVIMKGHKIIKSAVSGHGNEAHSYVYITDTDVDNHKIHVSVNDENEHGSRIIMKPDAKDLAKDEKIILIISYDGEEEIIIKGDAVITIKDGSLKVENGSGEEKEVKVVKEEKKVKKN